MSSNFEDMKNIIGKALADLYQKDKYLIINRPNSKNKRNSHVSERGIVFRFGIYLDNYTREYPFLKDYSIDVEYNRNFYEPKYLPSHLNGAFPDLIIHKRGSNEYNLLVMEFKTWWDNETNEDIMKIKEFMDHNGHYKYKYGVSVVLDKEKPLCNWIEVKI